MARTRLDALLVERGLFESRSRAAAAVMAGEVRLGEDGPRADKPGRLVQSDAPLVVKESPGFVSRGGQKLANALDRLAIDPRGAQLPRRGRFHRRLHRLPAPARGRARGGARRGVRRAPLADSHRSARDRGRAGQRARYRALEPALPARPDRGGRVVHLTREGASGRARLRRRALRLPGTREAPVRGRPRAGGEGRRCALPRRPPFGARGCWRQASESSAGRVLGYASSGLPGPAGNRESFVWIAEPGRAGALADVDAAAREVEP